MYLQHPIAQAGLQGYFIHQLEPNWSYAFVLEIKWREQLPKYSTKNFITSYTQCPAHTQRCVQVKVTESHAQKCPQQLPLRAAISHLHHLLKKPQTFPN